MLYTTSLRLEKRTTVSQTIPKVMLVYDKRGLSKLTVLHQYSYGASLNSNLTVTSSILKILEK